MQFAIVGASVRLPGVNDLDEFRTDLRQGHTRIRTVSDEESLASGMSPMDISEPRYVPAAATLDEPESFDRAFFSMTAGEARVTDPQHLLMLTLCHEALESAGLARDVLRIGTFLSVTSSTYLFDRILPEKAVGAQINYSELLGNDKDFISSRVAYKLGLTGPALTIQSACSSSLAAVHQACLALAYGDADAALVGAASVSFPHAAGYVHHDGGVMSPTGESRPFDSAANGTLKGNGGGAVVLRRLADAEADDDHILAVILGSAVNNDGRQKASFTAPSASGQQQVITDALRRARVAAADIRYVEAHGTGTLLGDPIEVRALSRAYGSSTPCHLGSLKASYGHLDAAAGIVGLLKVVLSLQNSEIFPQPNFTAPNLFLKLDSTCFRIPVDGGVLPEGGIAAVSSFGMGGTNAHVVVGPATRRADVSHGNGPVRVRLTGRSEDGLRRFRARLARYLARHPELSPADIAATLATRTVTGPVWSAVTDSAEELARLLADAPSVEEGGDVGPSTAGRRIWLPPTPLDPVPVTIPARTVSASVTTPAVTNDSVGALFRRAVADELGVPVDEHTDYFDAGGESITLVELVGKLARERGFAPRFADFDGRTTVGALAAELERQATGTNSRTAPRIISFGEQRPIYLHPPAGGTNFCYSALSKCSPGILLHAFTPVPDLGATIPAIAARNIDLLEMAGVLDTPGAILGGYSFGGNVGLETVLQLERRGYRPGHLVLFDSIPPQAYCGTPSIVDYDQAIDEVVKNATATSDSTDPPSAFIDLIGEGLDSTSAIYTVFQATWKSNQTALSAHRPAQRTKCAITLFSARDPLPDAERKLLSISEFCADDWQRFTEQPLRIVPVPGNHYSIFTDPANLRVLAEQLSLASQTFSDEARQYE